MLDGDLLDLLTRVLDRCANCGSGGAGFATLPNAQVDIRCLGCRMRAVGYPLPKEQYAKVQVALNLAATWNARPDLPCLKIGMLKIMMVEGGKHSRAVVSPNRPYDAEFFAKTFAELLNVADDRIRKALRKMEDAGVVEIQSQSFGGGRPRQLVVKLKEIGT